MTTDDLRREIDASRRAMQADYSALRAELDLGAKAKKAVVRNPLPWLGGAALLGFIVSGRRQPKAPKPSKHQPTTPPNARGVGLLGVLLALARLAFPLLRPALTGLATRQLASWAERFAR